MRIIYLPTIWTILLDSLAWALIQPLIGWLAMRFPENWLDPAAWLYRTRSWENKGLVYQKWFKVRAWKGNVPYGGAFFQDEFTMRRLGKVNKAHIQRWLQETCRAELTHWLAILPAPLFFLWNAWYVSIVMIVYAALFNMPLIIVQRYYRPRLENIQARLQRKKNPVQTEGHHHLLNSKD